MVKEAEKSTSALLISFALLLLLLPIGETGGTSSACSQACPNLPKTLCVAKPSSDETTLQLNIDFACSRPQVDCNVLLEEEKGCPCFKPNNLMSHASLAMNLYYQANGRHPHACDFENSALIVTTDPSYGVCVYA